MDQARLKERESLCVQEESPWCEARCPVHVDVKAMLAAAAAGDFDAAFAAFRKKVPFPRVLSRVCDQPCRSECRRAETGGSIRIRDIERACLDHVRNEPPAPVRLPRTGKKIAVVGAGLSGMTAAYELARKGHDVVVFEATASIGGRLLSAAGVDLPEDIIREELSAAERFGAEVKLGTRADMAALDGFDAVYLGTGGAGTISIDPATFSTGQERVFAGGSAVRPEPSFIGSVSDGRRAAVSIDRFLQGVSLDAGRMNEGSYATRLYTSLEGIAAVPETVPASGSAYSPEEAASEAARCILCECMECVKVCEYLRRYKAYPKRYVREVYNNLSIVMGMRKANEFIDSCSLCGLCAKVCPTGLSMAEIISEARGIMASKGKSPPSAFDFALRDLAFSTGPEFFLSRAEPGFERCGHLFFPGCQLSAVLPASVERAYADLRSGLEGGVALMLGCCGVPAEWAGQETAAAKVAEAVRGEWERLGRPTIIAGCPTCRRTLAVRLPEARVEHLLETLDRLGAARPAADAAASAGADKTIAVHDSCAARDDAELQKTVRRVVGGRGYAVAELKTSGVLTECCGYGGLMYNANRTLADAVAARRTAQSGADYVAYCAMCRERFLAQGKKTAHVLELLYGPERAVTGFSERRENRRRLRTRLLRAVWGEGTDGKENAMKIEISDEVRAGMEARFILLEDIEDVVRHAEATGEKLRDGSEGLFIANHRPGNVTYWVWYEKSAEGFVVRKAYSHRMGILGTKA